MKELTFTRYELYGSDLHDPTDCTVPQLVEYINYQRQFLGSLFPASLPDFDESNWQEGWLRMVEGWQLSLPAIHPVPLNIEARHEDWRNSPNNPYLSEEV
tara:strand:- start:5 stop:304 length:300 start_codon:yes stop_codon:yes gene_type:complete